MSDLAGMEQRISEPSFEEIQKYLLEAVNVDIEDMLADLQGKVWVETVEFTGYKVQNDRPKIMNDAGASKIRVIIKKYLTRTSMLGNISDYEYEQAMMSFVTVVIRELGDNKEVWDIPDGAEDTICDTLIDFVFIILTRARGGLDRGLFEKVQTIYQRISKGDEVNRMGVPSPYGGQ